MSESPTKLTNELTTEQKDIIKIFLDNSKKASIIEDRYTGKLTLNINQGGFSSLSLIYDKR